MGEEELPAADSPAFAALIRKVFRDPLRSRRIKALQAYMEKCGPEHLAAIIPLIRESDLRGCTNGEEWSLLWSEWGQKNGKSALEAIRETDWNGWDDRAPAEAQSRALAGWAALDPAAASAWLETTQEKLHHPPNLTKALLSGWSVADPQAAAAWLMGRTASSSEDYRTVVEAMSRKEGPEAVDAWLAGLDKSGNSTAAHPFADAVTSLKARLDPVAAAGWIEQHAKEGWMKDSPAIAGTAAAYVEKDPVAGMDWAVRTGLECATSTAMEQWCAKDITAASAWLQSHRESPNYNASVLVLVHNLREENPEAARQWAGTINDAALKAQVLETITQ